MNQHQNAWLKTIEDGIHTYDIYKEGISREKVGTRGFSQAVIARLGQKPTQLQAVSYSGRTPMQLPTYTRKPAAHKTLEGVDLFVHWSGTQADQLADQVQKLNTDNAQLSMITNRGIKVWPEGFEETFCTDHWRCRFKPTAGHAISKATIIQLLTQAAALGIDVVKTENLYAFDGQAAYSLGQGQ